ISCLTALFPTDSEAGDRAIRTGLPPASRALSLFRSKLRVPLAQPGATCRHLLRRLVAALFLRGRNSEIYMVEAAIESAAAARILFVTKSGSILDTASFPLSSENFAAEASSDESTFHPPETLFSSSLSSFIN